MILFIDELHTGWRRAGVEGAMDRAIAQAHLPGGELHCIGATTVDESGNTWKKDSALERRFAGPGDQPSVGDTISILRGLKGRYEVPPRRPYRDAALGAAAVWSTATFRSFSPDKAID